MRLLFIFTIFFSLISCNDEGSPIPEINQDPDVIVKLLNDSGDVPNLYFRHGAGVCYGYWEYLRYAKCKHPFHGQMDPDIINYPFLEVNADSQAKAIDLCESSTILDEKIPPDVDVLSMSVKLKEPGLHLCIAKLSRPKYKVMRSPACDLDYELGRQSNELMGRNLSEIDAIEGTVGAGCQTCDHLPITDASQVQDKFFCLVGQYLKLGKKNPSIDEIAMRAELVEVLDMFLNGYRFLLAPGQIDGIEKILRREGKN